LSAVRIEISKEASRVGDGHVREYVTITLNFASVHVIEFAAVLLKTTFYDDEFGDARAFSRIVHGNAHANFGCCRVKNIDDLRC